MAEFEVPQAAVEAGLTAWKDAATCMPEQDVRVVLYGATPFIAAAALRQAAEDMWDRTDGLAQIYAAWLRMRADQLDGHRPSPDTREGILDAAGLTEADMAERRTAAWLATLPGPDAWARKHSSPPLEVPDGP